MTVVSKGVNTALLIVYKMRCMRVLRSICFKRSYPMLFVIIPSIVKERERVIRYG